MNPDSKDLRRDGGLEETGTVVPVFNDEVAKAGQALLEGDPDSSGDEQFGRFWQEFIGYSVNTARTYLHLRKAAIEDTGKLKILEPSNILNVSQRGPLVTMDVNQYREQLNVSFPPGTPVKIICRDTEGVMDEPEEEGYDRDMEWTYRSHRSRFEEKRHRKKKKEPSPDKKYSGKTAIILKAVVKSINPSSGSIFSITFELQERGQIRNDWNIQVERNESTRVIGKELNLIEEFSDDNTPKTVCAEFFRKGKFYVDRDKPRERRDNLDERQNQIYGLSLEETAEVDLANRVLFLHGPPGSGKTTTLCEIAREHARRGRKVLVLSHSNKAIEVPVAKISEHGKKEKSLLHIAGNVVDKIDPRLHKFRMKRRLKYPQRDLEELSRMSDEDFFEKNFLDEMENIRTCLLKRMREDESFRRWSPDENTQPQKTDADLMETNVFMREKGLEIQRVLAERNIVQLKGYVKDDILRNYRERLESEKRKFQKSMEKGGIVFSTLGTLISDEFLADMEFDVVIIDEDTRLRTPDLILALKKAGKQIVFVGDPLQLGNIPLEREQRKALEESLDRESRSPKKEHTSGQVAEDIRGKIFDLYESEEASEACDIFEEGPAAAPILRVKDRERHLPYVFLNKNRRSLPNIVRLLSELIYDGKLEPGREIKDGENQEVIEWIDTKNIEAEERMAGTSRRNPAEAEIIARRVLQRIKQGARPEDVALIATYREQAILILKRLDRMLNHGVDKKTGKPSEKDLANRRLFAELRPNINSVDAFQGEERKIVFVSLTRSNEEGHIGFLDEERRIGVAIGRAQDELYIVGDSRTVVDRNTNAESRAFFGKMQRLVSEFGQIEERRAA